MSRLPQVKGERVVQALKKEGWYIDRSHGSHIVMRHEDRPGVKIVIPVHTKPVTPGTLNNILDDAELSVERLKELL